MTARTAGLVARHGDAWRSATRHPFLDGVRDATVSVAAFDSWLAQDYLFVAELLGFQARLLARSPRVAQATLAAGLVALEAELGWFEEQAAERGLNLDGPPAPATAAYCALLVRLDAAPYAAAITALWALERVYLEAWTSAAPGASAYRRFVEHWTTADFAGYVAALERAADAVWADERAVEDAFLAVLAVERDFWEMAWTLR